MPDITMCAAEECTKKNQCYRFTAEPSTRQSYFDGLPTHRDGVCRHFWQDEQSLVKLNTRSDKTDHIVTLIESYDGEDVSDEMISDCLESRGITPSQLVNAIRDLSEG